MKDGQDFYSESIFTSQDIEYGINNSEFYLLYQPIVDTLTGRIVSYEALARWDCKERLGYNIPPNVFMFYPEMPMIKELTKYLLRKAEATEKIKGVPIHFNFSGYDLSLIPDTSLSSIEIIEDNIDNSVVKFINKAKKQIWIDDFMGGGVNNLRYLPLITLTGIKIDKSVIDCLNYSIPEISKYFDLINSFVNLFHSWGLLMVAEGVETKEQYGIIKQLNIDYCQGYLFGKPLIL